MPLYLIDINSMTAMKTERELLYEDFTKRELHQWLHQTHNAHALAKQFPKYPLNTLYRVRAGIRPKYMPERVYLTLKGIMDFAEYHRREAYRLSNTRLELKYGISREKLRIHYKEWKGTL